MKIKFEHNEGYCLTPCPFGMINEYSDLGDVKLVGSNACSDCIHFVSNDFEENLVECNCKENINLK